MQQFDFAFDAATRPLLALVGVVPSTAHVTLAGERLVAHPGLTVTVADREGFAAAVRAGAGLV